MPSNYLTLGQVNPTLNTLTSLYTVPAATSAIASTLVIANLGTGTNYRIAIRPAGEAINAKHYIAYDTFISANDSIFLTLGITLSATDVISVYAGSSTVSFSVFGVENS